MSQDLLLVSICLLDSGRKCGGWRGHGASVRTMEPLLNGLIIPLTRLRVYINTRNGNTYNTFFSQTASLNFRSLDKS